MDDKKFQELLKGIGTMPSVQSSTANPIQRGAFGLPITPKQAPEVKKSEQTLTGKDNPVGNLPVIKQATQFGVGIGSAIGKAGLGLGQTFLKGANVISNLMGNEKNQYNPIIQKMEELKQGIFEDPYKKELGTLAGKAGKLTGDIATFAEGNAPIAKGQQYLSGASKALNITNKYGRYATEKLAQIIPEAVGAGATQYGISGGNAQEAGTVGIVGGVLSGITHVGSDVFTKLIPQTVKEAVSRAFIPRGKMSVSGTENITDDAVGALTTIKNLAPEIKVKDINGIEKPFNPAKATSVEMPQVLTQAKNKIYQEYSNLATKAGDKGVTVAEKDFLPILGNLSKYEGAGYTPAYSTKANQIVDAIERFGTKDAQGNITFKDATPDQIQTLIEAINYDVNPLSDKAGAKVALDASQQLRSMLDTKIENATGEGYQQLRNAYKQLKSIEPTIVAEFKKAMRGQGIKSDIIDSIASVDTIVGILTSSPEALVRGGAWEAVKQTMKSAFGKEANLQRAFKLLGKAEQDTPALAQRLYAKPSENSPAFKSGEKAVEDFKAMPNKEGGFISLGGKEFPKLNEVKVPNAPEGTSINVGLKTNIGGEITDQEVKDIIKKEFNVDVVESAVQQSGTEPTLIAKLSRPLTDDELYKLSELTKQDAIPQLSNGVGKMTNIGKESWGDFNPEYFMDTNGKTMPINAPETMPAKINKSTENRLLIEAKKFKTFEEFKKSITEDRGGIGKGVEYSPVKRMVETGINDKPLTDFGFKPEEMVTVYRGVDNASQKTIKEGDYIATSYDLAKSYTDGNVISKEVPASSVRFASSDGITANDFKNGFNETHLEAVYNPNPLVKESQLEDIWNKANN